MVGSALSKRPTKSQVAASLVELAIEKLLPMSDIVKDVQSMTRVSDAIALLEGASAILQPEAE